MRFTGGEPLVRRGLVDIVAPDDGDRPDRSSVSLTTNALGLARRPPRWPTPASTGSTSASTPCGPRRSQTITRRDRYDDVIEGLEAAQAAGLAPVKVNAVLLRGVNDDEAPELLRWAVEHGYELRFIEQMPLDAQHGWSREEMVTADEIFGRSRRGVRRSPRTASPAGAPRPSCSSSTAARPPSA